MQDWHCCHPSQEIRSARIYRKRGDAYTVTPAEKHIFHRKRFVMKELQQGESVKAISEKSNIIQGESTS